ncbi:PAS domain-containing protein [Marinibaculum pumilum]|uniref:histidine kinase n=1 Tax=Marinibaculum pumilum TaxID=1766165 RepID=A0ABV7LA20_9PROT
MGAGLSGGGHAPAGAAAPACGLPWWRRSLLPAGGAIALAGAAVAAWLAPLTGATAWLVPAGILLACLGATIACAALLDRDRRRQLAALQAELALSHQRLEDYVDASGEIFWETDTEHRLTDIRGGATDLVKGEPYRHMGKQPWTQALDADDEEKWSRFRTMLAERRTFRGLSYRLMTDDGPAVRMVSGMPRYAPDGRFLGYRGASVERTDQAQQAQDLALYRQILDNCVDSIIVTGPVSADCPIEYVNPAFERLTGYAAAEAIGRNCRFLQGPDTEPEALQRIAAALKAAQAIQVELKNRHKDGTPLFLQLSIAPVIDKAGRAERFIGIQHDITPQHQAAEAEHLLSERLSLAVGATGIGIYDIDLQTGSVTWDETMERLYGIPAGSFDGAFATWQSFLHPDDLVRHAEAMREAMASRRGLVIRTRIVRPDGAVRVMQFRTATLKDANGKVTRLLGVNRDVTEEHEAQESLRTLSRRLTLATEAAGIGIFDLDLATRRVAFDRQLADLYGLDLARFDGRLSTWRRYIDPDDVARIDADFLAHRYSAEPHSTTLRITRTDGTRRILQEHAVILHDDDGEPARIIGVNWDITGPQEAQATLERLTRRLTLTARTAGIGFFDWEEGTDRGGWDDTLRELHGVPADFQGDRDAWLALLAPEQRQRAKDFIADRFRTRRPGQMEYRIACPDGSLRDLQIHIAPDVDASGRVVRLMGAAWDVTGERETQRQLRKARDAARAANDAKDRFLATMSHELRTPLNAILGFSEVIAQEAVGPLGTPAYRDYANDIHSSGQHLLSLVNDLIDVARIQSARIRLTEDRIPVGSLLQRLPPLLGERGYTEEIPDNLAQAEILGDSRLLAQVLVNLVSNARKHAGQDAPVHVGAGRLPSGALTIWVTDQGPGIEAEDQQLVLEPFGRKAATEDAAIPGVGLGLPIARSYVQAHGGQLYLHSAPGLGTTVGLILPPERMTWPQGKRQVAVLPRITDGWPAGPCLGCLRHEADGVVRGSLPTGLVLEHDGRCTFTGAESDVCAHWGEQVLRDLGGIDALSDPMRPRQAFAICRLDADGAETECLVEVRRGARAPCRAFVTPVTGAPAADGSDEG